MKSMTMRGRALLKRKDTVLRERFLLLLQRQWKMGFTVSALGLLSLLFLTTTLTAAVSTVVPANFVKIPAGEFTMGSPASEIGRQNDETQHQVRLSSFYMSKYAVTVAEFRKFVEATGYRTDAEKDGWSIIVNYYTTTFGYASDKTEEKDGVNWRYGVSGSVRPASEDNHPVIHVSWNDAVAYGQWMSAKTGKTYRLPTEAEREYACRAGSVTAFNTGNTITLQQANVTNAEGQYRANTVPVDSFAPNAWGLYNMHGNVYDWCSDWYGDYGSGTVSNPVGPATGSDRVNRGGSWRSRAVHCRSALRYYSTPPPYRNISVGFRLVFVP